MALASGRPRLARLPPFREIFRLRIYFQQGRLAWYPSDHRQRGAERTDLVQELAREMGEEAWNR
jgi:hypothetical protein